VPRNSDPKDFTLATCIAQHCLMCDEHLLHKLQYVEFELVHLLYLFQF